jgi:hypothetical protein
MVHAWESEWAALDSRTRGRLRRAAFRGRAVSDPREAALVAAFARNKASDRRERLISWHLAIILGVTCALVLHFVRHDGTLAWVYVVILALAVASLAFILGARRRLMRASELNDRVH